MSSVTPSWPLVAGAAAAGVVVGMIAQQYASSSTERRSAPHKCAKLTRMLSTSTRDTDAVEPLDEELLARVRDELESEFGISVDQLEIVAERIRESLQEGLAKNNCDIKMLPSYVHRLPTGDECGDFLALDLGGSNFRVLKLTLAFNSRSTMESKKYKLTDELQQGTGEALFDFIADCVADFVPSTVGASNAVPLGFTFSFPVNQTSIHSGTLAEWTKGFSASGVVGKDVVELLQKAFARKNVKVHVAALVNDTVGTLLAQAEYDSETAVGLILGTGTNACYVERIAKVGKWTEETREEKVIINMEWGGFADRSVLPFNKYDQSVDQLTPNKGRQVYEKMISGMYLGEIARHVCVDLISRQLLFDGRSSTPLTTPWGFSSHLMSEVENDKDSALSQVELVVTGGLRHHYRPSLTDCAILKVVCECVSTRAARLAAAGIAAVVDQMYSSEPERNRNYTVAVDGSVFQHYPSFDTRMTSAMDDLYRKRGLTHNVRFHRAEDGSGRGAALCAALAIQSEN